LPAPHKWPTKADKEGIFRRLLCPVKSPCLPLLTKGEINEFIIPSLKKGEIDVPIILPPLEKGGRGDFRSTYSTN
jgi:hypothetical protein